MFACAASGDQLHPYVVYKAEQLQDNWVRGGPMYARYNRMVSGWFDQYCFTDWLAKIAVPYFRKIDNDCPRELIGDNLASHVGADTLALCEENSIRFDFLPPNSTHLLQPLDVAVYGPMKKTWRKVLTKWKSGPGRQYTALEKTWFPALLLQLLEEMDNRAEKAVAGFKATGIYPLDSDHIVRKLRHEEAKPAYDLVTQMVLDHLRELRESAKAPSSRSRGPP